MVMGEVSLCRVKELPPVVAGELRPALADESAALFVDRVPHESVVRLWPVTAVPMGAPLLARGWWPPMATHQKAVIGALANRFQNVANLARGAEKATICRGNEMALRSTLRAWKRPQIRDRVRGLPGSPAGRWKSRHIGGPEPDLPGFSGLLAPMNDGPMNGSVIQPPRAPV
jgi:hypothetical protein